MMMEMIWKHQHMMKSVPIIISIEWLAHEPLIKPLASPIIHVMSPCNKRVAVAHASSQSNQSIVLQRLARFMILTKRAKTSICLYPLTSRRPSSLWIAPLASPWIRKKSKRLNRSSKRSATLISTKSSKTN
jgi:hypothetical protein